MKNSWRQLAIRARSALGRERREAPVDDAEALLGELQAVVRLEAIKISSGEALPGP